MVHNAPVEDSLTSSACTCRAARWWHLFWCPLRGRGRGLKCKSTSEEPQITSSFMAVFSRN